MSTCKTCKHWCTDADWAYPESDDGYCDSEDFRKAIRHEDDPENAGWVDTPHWFGCIFHTPVPQ